MIELQSEEQVLENKKYMLERQFEHMIGNMELNFQTAEDEVMRLVELVHEKIKNKSIEIEEKTVEICIENFHKRFDLEREEFREDFEFSSTIAYNEHAMEAFHVIRTLLSTKLFLDELINFIQSTPSSEVSETANKYFNETFDYEKEAKEKAEQEELEKQLKEAQIADLTKQRTQFALSNTIMEHLEKEKDMIIDQINQHFSTEKIRNDFLDQIGIDKAILEEQTIESIDKIIEHLKSRPAKDSNEQ